MSLMILSFILIGTSFHNIAPLKAMDVLGKLRSYLGGSTFPDTADLVRYECISFASKLNYSAVWGETLLWLLYMKIPNSSLIKFPTDGQPS